jgi:hypothetical protein
MFDKTLNDEFLNGLSFLDYLKWMKDRISRLSYSKGSSRAYSEAREIIQHIIRRYKKHYGLTDANYHDEESGNMLRINETDLDDYTKFAKTDKAKTEVINQFREDMDSDLHKLIFEVENEQQ